jgi:hypothetical protein
VAITKLSLYNNALLLLGQRRLTSDTEATETRYKLDVAYDQDAANYCLEMVKPRFALLVAKLETSTTPTTSLYTHTHALPAGYVALHSVFQDGELDESINRFFVEGDTITSDYSTIYARYVQDGVAISSWSPSFANVVSAFLATQIAPSITPQKVAIVEQLFVSRLEAAQNIEASQEPGQRSRKYTSTLSNSWRNLYNDALMIIGKTHLVSNDDDSRERSAMDAILDQGVVATVLEEQGWTFALVSQKVTYDPSLEPEWGYRRVFAMPTDLHRIDGVYQDEYFTTALADYQLESGQVYCELDDIYIQYVKTSYINNPSAWPQYYRNIVAAEMAVRAAPGLSPQMLTNARDQRRIRNNEGQSTDAMSGPSQLVKRGNWSRSKSGFGRQSRERG